MNGFPQNVRNAAASWFGNGPWRSKSVLAALVAVTIGLGFWFSEIKKGTSQDSATIASTPAALASGSTSGSPSVSEWNWSRPLPWYVRMGASYVAAYCLGWLFRRVLKLILLAGVLAFALLAYGKFAGWKLTHAQTQVKQGGEWARETAAAEKERFKKLLPSATAGAVGVFMGFRRRNQARSSSAQP